MIKKISFTLAVILSITGCSNKSKTPHYRGKDISSQVEIIKNIELKTTHININFDSPWQLYAGESVDSIAFSNPIASGKGQGSYPVDVQFYPRSYFQLNSPDGDALLSERHLPLEGGYNFRDLGGYRTSDGRYVKWGKVFRTDDMHHLTETDLDYLASLDIHTVIDFRSKEEISAGADKLPSTTQNHILLPIIPGNLTGINDIEQLDSIKSIELMKNMYISLCSEEQIIEQYKRFFMFLQDEEKLPLSFHCTAGKDRTGLGAALFLYSLGVEEEVIIEDFLLSNKYLEKKYADLIAQHPEMRPVWTVNEIYLRTAFDRIKADHGTITKFLETTLGVDIEKIREIYLF